LVCPGFTSGAAAEVVRDLYRAETVITGTEEPERSRGLREAFADLVVKLTGNASLKNDVRLVSLLQRAGDFVQEIEFEDRMRGIPVHDEQGTRERPHYLRVRFRPETVERALADHGIKVWPADRPLVAVWFKVDTASDEYLLEPDGAKGYGQREVFHETARRLGLPIALAPQRPERLPLTPADLAESDISRVREATTRGGALLVGSIVLTATGSWDAWWLLEWEGTRTRWDLGAVTFDTAIKDGLQRTARILAQTQKPDCCR
jgi:hypothetical protein